jgi:hypothetical protein
MSIVMLKSMKSGLYILRDLTALLDIKMNFFLIRTQNFFSLLNPASSKMNFSSLHH